MAKRLPHDPKPPKNPNEGSVKRRNEKKRIKQRKAFIVVCACITFFPLILVSQHDALS